MKKLAAIVLLSLFAIPAFSQVKFGIKAGAATTTVPTYDFTTGENNIEALKNAQFGFHAGAFLRISLLGFYVMPEVVFASTTYDYDVTVGSIPSEVLKQQFNKINIPLLLGFHLGPVRLNAGPAASILINSPKALIDNPDFPELYRSATFGYEAGLGVDLFKKLTIDLRYN